MLHPWLKILSSLHKPYNILFLVSFAVLMTLQCSYYFYQNFQEQKAQHKINQYGEYIAAITADQAAGNVLSNNAISLQAIAQNLHSHNIASSVVIYNINHDILAQTNTVNPLEAQQLHYYTAPIASNNNIIGSVTIGIASSLLITETHYMPIGMLSLLLMTIMLIAFIKGRSASNSENSHQKSSDSGSTYSTTEGSTQELVEQEVKIEQEENVVFLTLTLHNIDQLYQQLNAEMRQQQLQTVEQHITHAIRLYNGEKHMSSPNTITLCFKKSSDLLHCLFAAQLILQLNHRNTHSLLSISALIHNKPQKETINYYISLNRKIQTVLQQQQGLYIQQAIAQQLSKKASFEQTNVPHLLRVSALNNNYQTLLEKQLKQLLKNN